jgi:hypothetical protein
MEENKSFLEKTIDRLEEAKQIKDISDDAITMLNFSINIVKHAIPVVEAQIEAAKMKGRNEAFKEMLGKFEIEEEDIED